MASAKFQGNRFKIDGEIAESCDPGWSFLIWRRVYIMIIMNSMITDVSDDDSPNHDWMPCENKNFIVHLLILAWYTTSAAT